MLVAALSARVKGDMSASEQILADEAATAALAARLARAAAARDLIALRGPLGAGKTAFARAFIQSRATAAGRPEIAARVPSPTFTLVQSYALPDAALWHFDLYRLGDAEELWELGWEEARDGVTLVEWPERAEERMPADRLDLALDPQADETRIVRLAGPGAMAARLIAAAEAVPA